MMRERRPPVVADAGDLAALPDILQFMQLLWAVVHGVERTSKRMAGEIGVRGPQRLVLRVVGLFPGISAGHLASVLHVHPSTLTGVVQRLVAQRLLDRADDPADRRRAVLRLTKAGARVNAARRHTVEAAIAQARAAPAARSTRFSAREEAMLRSIKDLKERGCADPSSPSDQAW